MTDQDQKDHDSGTEQLQGKGEEIKGKVQQAWGDLTDDERLQAEGQGNEVKGKVRQTKADVEETIDKAKERFTR